MQNMPLTESGASPSATETSALRDKNDPTNDPVESGSDGKRPPRLPIPLKLLRWMELWGLWAHYGRVKKTETTDAWYTNYNDEVQGPVGFGQVMRALLRGESPLYVVHSSKVDGDPTWFKLTYAPLWLQTWPARIVVAFFWIACAMALFCAIQSVTPYWLQLPIAIVYWVALAAWVGRRFLPKKGKAAPASSPAPESVSEESV